MARINSLGYIRELLYELKKDYGYPLDVYTNATYTVDPKNGARTTTRTVVRIKKAILLPSTLSRKFAYEHSFLAANRPFSYGAQYDINTRIVIVDVNDVPKDFEFIVDGSTVFESRRYQIKSAERFDHRLAYLLTLVETVGEVPQQILECNVFQDFNIQQGTDNDQ